MRTGPVLLGMLALLGLLAAVAAGCGGTRTVTTTVTATVKSDAEPPRRQIWFGTIRSLVRGGPGYVLRFDPQWFLGGVTATAAAVEDGAIELGDPVPNDYYRVDEGGRMLTFRVPQDARVTVLAGGVQGTRVTVAQLARLVRDESALGHPLFEPLRTGFWLQVDVDTVRSLDQQYVP